MKKRTIHLLIITNSLLILFLLFLFIPLPRNITGNVSAFDEPTYWAACPQEEQYSHIEYPIVRRHFVDLFKDGYVDQIISCVSKCESAEPNTIAIECRDNCLKTEWGKIFEELELLTDKNEVELNYIVSKLSPDLYFDELKSERNRYDCIIEANLCKSCVAKC